MTIQRLALAGAVAVLAACGSESAAPPPPPVLTLPGDGQPALEAARAATGRLATRLRAELTAAIEQGGAELAIEVCKDRAPAIAAEEQASFNGTIGRTSLRLRNPDNEPGDWEIEVLGRFAAQMAAGRAAAGLEAAEVATAADGARILRYARAIPTETACLVCHGNTIPQPVKAKLDLNYPDDHATGFREGELRGIFTALVPLPPG
jgi:hypothetical protein